jgi:L-threonylcarbamoyladenylate synthase
MASIIAPTLTHLRQAAQCIRAGGLVVCPSDTNLAIALDPWNPAAVARVFAVKRRPANSPLTFFVERPEQWRLYGESTQPELVDQVVAAFWPGPLNIILTARADVPRAALMGSDTVALGCLANPTPRGLIREVGRAVAMTSANLSGQANGVLVDLPLAVRQIGEDVDMILDGGALSTTMSSTIIDLSGTPHMLRLGDISRADLAPFVTLQP